MCFWVLLPNSRPNETLIYCDDESGTSTLHDDENEYQNETLIWHDDGNESENRTLIWSDDGESESDNVMTNENGGDDDTNDGHDYDDTDYLDATVTVYDSLLQLKQQIRLLSSFRLQS